jgi:hypothetical protein
MDQKPKTRGSPTKDAKPKAKDEKQFERFIETVKLLKLMNLTVVLGKFSIR